MNDEIFWGHSSTWTFIPMMMIMMNKRYHSQIYVTFVTIGRGNRHKYLLQDKCKFLCQKPLYGIPWWWLLEKQVVYFHHPFRRQMFFNWTISECHSGRCREGGDGDLRGCGATSGWERGWFCRRRWTLLQYDLTLHNSFNSSEYSTLTTHSGGWCNRLLISAFVNPQVTLHT
jgi:hypothetical protein